MLEFSTLRKALLLVRMVVEQPEEHSRTLNRLAERDKQQKTLLVPLDSIVTIKFCNS